MGFSILGAIGGAGSAMQDVGSTMLKSDLDLQNRTQLQTQASDLELSRQKALAQFSDELKNAPLNRLSASAQQFAQKDVPVTAAPVSSVGGFNPAPDGFNGPMDEGFKGNVGVVASAIKTIPAGPDRDAAIAQLQRQLASDQDMENRGVVGKVRKMTSDESMQAAVDAAKSGDLPAYAAYEAHIGKPLRDERKLDLSATREDNRMALAAQQEQRRWEIESGKLALGDQRDATNNKKIDALIDHWNNQDAAKLDPLGKAGSPERMTSIINAMNNSIRDMDSNKPRTSASEAEKTAWTEQRANAIAVRSRAMQRLDSNFNDTSTPPPAAPAPAPAASTPAAPKAADASLPPGLPAGSFQIGTSGGKPVYQSPDGKKFIAQ